MRPMHNSETYNLMLKIFVSDLTKKVLELLKDEAVIPDPTVPHSALSNALVIFLSNAVSNGLIEEDEVYRAIDVQKVVMKDAVKKRLEMLRKDKVSENKSATNLKFKLFKIEEDVKLNN